MTERDESFEHDDLGQWASDCIWALDNEKVRALLLDIFSRRTRLSNIQARLWKRVVDLYWREGRTKTEIAEQFGVGKEDIRRIVRNLRGEAKDFFDVYGQPIVRTKTRKPAKPKAIPITADPANESQKHWNAVLVSHGLYEPDTLQPGPLYDANGQRQWRHPTCTFHWPLMQSSDGSEWGYTFGWGEFLYTKSSASDEYDDTDNEERPRYQFIADGPSTEDAERFAGFLAHVPTLYADHRMGDVDLAIDGDPEAREYLRQYGQLEKFNIVPAIPDPCEGRPFMQKLSAPKASNDVYIAEDGSVYERGSNKLCGHIERQDRPRKQFDAQIFFATYKRNNSAVTESNTDMEDYKQIAEIIKQYDIPRTTVARICGMHAPDLSGYLNGRLDLPDEKVERIAQTVADIARIVNAMGEFGIKPDLRNIENVKHLIRVANDEQMQINLPLPETEPSPDSASAAN